jgi:Tfp pilus assembly protein PilN
MIQAAAAVLLLVFSQQIYLTGLQRELAVVRAKRSSIAPAIHSALAVRASAESLSRQLHTIDLAQESTWRWSTVVAALASELPDSVYLLSLNGRGAEIHLTGVAPSASAVIPALASSRLFASVALESPVERVPQSGEKFEVGANVSPARSKAREATSDSLRKRSGS